MTAIANAALAARRRRPTVLDEDCTVLVISVLAFEVNRANKFFILSNH
jgi:hypothetical protein